MTRKEAFQNRPMMEDIGEGNRIDAFIQKIYNDLDNRVCTSCKHSNDIAEDRYTCNLINCSDVFHEDFGCNKWEAEDEFR